MAAAVMLTCQNTFRPFFYHGSSAMFSLRAPLCKAALLPLSARFLCTRDIKPRPGGRQTDRRDSGQSNGQRGIRGSTTRRSGNELWDDDVNDRGMSSSLRQRPSFPKSVFAAGTAKKTAEMQKRKEALVPEDHKPPGQLESEVRTTRTAGRMQPPERPLSAEEWGNLRESLGNLPRFEFKMMRALFTSGEELDIAKSLLTFVAMEKGMLSYELLLHYLALCVLGGHDAEVFDVYDIMRGSFPSLDTGASSLFIKSFSRTERWHEALKILQELNKVFSASTRNYSDVISAAVLHNDLTTAWALYDELIKKGLSPHQDTWDALFKGGSKATEEKGEEAGAMCRSEQQEQLLGILLYMRDNQIYPKQSLAVTIKTWFESLAGQKWTGSWTSSTANGVCRCCRSELESIELTAEEYQELKDKVMANIIQGQDDFKKTTPKELETFKMFMRRQPAFDVVVDGLNVANISKDKRQLSETLLAVVSELERQGLTILVLGRKHMLHPSRSWDKHNMAAIQKKAQCFFTENISEDDPFLLYATLHSGNHCKFVSKDLMRDHKACLPDGATRRLFFKWQRGHQLVVDRYMPATRRVRFQSILSYDTIVQTSGDSWHLPYDSTEDRSSYEVPQRWLCLSNKH